MSFVIVRYGSGEEKIVNPNTLNSVFLSHLKKVCGFETLSEPIDLASENGEVMDLVSRPKDYAKKTLEGRGTYILVKVVTGEENQEDGSPTFVSLLDQPLSNLKFSLTNVPMTKARTTTKAPKGTTGLKISTAGTGGNDQDSSPLSSAFTPVRKPVPPQSSPTVVSSTTSKTPTKGLDDETKKKGLSQNPPQLPLNASIFVPKKAH